MDALLARWKQGSITGAIPAAPRQDEAPDKNRDQPAASAPEKEPPVAEVSRDTAPPPAEAAKPEAAPATAAAKPDDKGSTEAPADEPAGKTGREETAAPESGSPPGPPASPAGDNESDRVDELLRQFRERYGRR
jgi:hypothetical protein